jgi:hypothetical protein
VEWDPVSPFVPRDIEDLVRVDVAAPDEGIEKSEGLSGVAASQVLHELDKVGATRERILEDAQVVRETLPLFFEGVRQQPMPMLWRGYELLAELKSLLDDVADFWRLDREDSWLVRSQ